MPRVNIYICAHIMEENFWFALGLTLFAGLSTGIGSFIGLFTKATNHKGLSFAMGFSAGVMIYISFTELFFQGQESLINELGEKGGSWAAAISFFVGISLIAGIDKFIPSYENPHEYSDTTALEVDENKIKTLPKAKLMRTGMFTAIALGIHNFPEGMATFAGALKDVSLGIPIAVAIAIHNIPEGLAVSVPIYYATGNRKKAFFYSFLSGLAEPVGGLLGYLILRPFFNDLLFGYIFTGIAGIMVFIALDQLLPAAEEYGEHHHGIYGLVTGMAVMAVSLLLFL